MSDPYLSSKCTVTESTIGYIEWREVVDDIAQVKVRIDHPRLHPLPYLRITLHLLLLARLRPGAEYRSRCDANWPAGGPGELSTLTISRRPQILAMTASPGHPIDTTRRSFGVRSSTTNESSGTKVCGPTYNSQNNCSIMKIRKKWHHTQVFCHIKFHTIHNRHIHNPNQSEPSRYTYRSPKAAS